MNVYKVDGSLIQDDNNIYISDIKKIYTSYSDDQLLNEAIKQAQNKGKSSRIIWDGEDIYFTGQTTHICKGFGGIDFNGSKIYMPDYDNGAIIRIDPDSTTDITVPASDIYDIYTTNNNIKGKVAQFNNKISGNADMCLGNREPYATYSQVMYSSPTVKITPDGLYETGKLFLVPTSGDVACYNVHDIPYNTFVIQNGEIITYASNKMSILISCYRSNTHIHNFKFSGKSTISTFHSGPILVSGCSDIEIDHLYGINPVQLTSGYIFSLNQVSCAYMHDVAIGDSTEWGAVGCGNLTNTVWERCYMNRWDCHYAQYGYNIIRDCVVNEVLYGIGNGTLLVENSTIIYNKEASNNDVVFFGIRDDVVGVYDGDIIVNNCDFIPGNQAANKTIVINDSCAYAKPLNSVFNSAPNKKRYITKCRIPDGCKYVFQTGTATVADQPMFANLEYNVEDTIVGANTTILHPLGSQTATDATVTDYHKKISV